MSARFPAFAKIVALIALFVPFAAQAGEFPRLGLAEAMRRALDQNPSARAAALSASQAASLAAEARSAYDPQLSADAGERKDRSDRAVPVFGTDIRTTVFGAGLQWNTPSGLGLGLNLDQERTDSNSPFATNRVSYASSLGLELSLPLARNRGGASTRARILAAEARALEAKLSQEDVTEEVLAQAASAWWSLLAAQVQVAVLAESRDHASEFLAAVKEKQATLGTAEDVDVLAAESELARRESELLEAGFALDSAGRRLALVLGERESLRAEGLFPATIEQPEGWGGGLDGRRDLAALAARMAAARAELDFARSERRPAVDLLLSASQNGVDPDLGEAWSETWSGKHPAVFLGLRFGSPAWRKGANERAWRARLELERLREESRAAEDRAFFEASETFERVVALGRRLALARDQVALNLSKRDAERAKFDEGRSGSDRLLRFEDDLRLSRRAEVELAAALERSRIEHRRAVNRLLEGWQE